MNDIKADHLYERFCLLFPSWEEKIAAYTRIGPLDILKLKTNSKNVYYFGLNGTELIFTSNKHYALNFVKGGLV